MRALLAELEAEINKLEAVRPCFGRAPVHAHTTRVVAHDCVAPRQP
jgi:hypothetical protein